MQEDREASVLIVDDAGIVNETCSRTLRKAGFFVRSVRDPREAFGLMRERPAHAVLLDLRMPAMTGLDLMRLLKDTWPETEIVIMTAYPEDAMVRQVMELGASALITKPFPSLAEVRRETAKAVIRCRLRRKLPLDSECLLRIALVEEGRVGFEEFERALRASRDGELGLDLALTEEGLDSGEFERAIMDFLGVPLLSLGKHPPDLNLIKCVPFGVARRLNCLPVALQGGALLVAAADPFDGALRCALEEAAAMPVILGKAEEAEILAALSVIERELLRSRLPFSEVLARHQSGEISDLELLSVAILTGEGEFVIESAEVHDSGPQAFSYSFRGVLTLQNQRDRERDATAAASGDR
jgi:CheY-like chemotaxis protein